MKLCKDCAWQAAHRAGWERAIEAVMKIGYRKNFEEWAAMRGSITELQYTEPKESGNEREKVYKTETGFRIGTGDAK